MRQTFESENGGWKTFLWADMNWSVGVEFQKTSFNDTADDLNDDLTLIYANGRVDYSVLVMAMKF